VTPTEEDHLVAGLLEAAKAPSGGPEHKGEASLSAFRSLAAARGVPLETVLRAAVRDELRTIAALPALRPNRHGSRPVTDARAVEGDDPGTTCRVIR